MKHRWVIWLATGFGLGYAPVASGTFGSLPGVALAVGLAMGGMGWLAQLAVCLVLAAVAVPICTAAERQFGEKDDGRIVADEYLTFPLCLVGIPWLAHPWFLAVAFVVNRVMDIVKPPPARGIQDLPEGWGVLLDDFVAFLYALAVNHALYWFVVARYF
jgi:phosphatidylglycerophosphatase A